jgi:hypothetical protein
LTDQTSESTLSPTIEREPSEEDGSMNDVRTGAIDAAPRIAWWTDLDAAQVHAREVRRPLYVDIWAPG